MDRPEAVTAASVFHGVAGGYRQSVPSTVLVARHGPGDGRLDVHRSYRLCRRVTAAHARTYYFASRFLPASRRRHVHALYAFARYADDLVDDLDLGWSPARRRAAFQRWADGFLASLASGDTDDPLLVAVLDSVKRLAIDHGDLRAFLRSMAMDLEITRYESYDDLYEYVHGSAAVIGSMMLPVLGAHPDARDRAMDLGVAFQLTNFLRDVAEDWARGRIYLPLEDLDRFGVSEWDFRSRHVGPAFRRLLAFEIARTRALYRRAEAGWAMLPPSSRTCVRIAHRLYAGILDEIEACDYQVFRARAAVPTLRRLTVAAREVVVPSRPTMATAATGCHHGRWGGSRKAGMAAACRLRVKPGMPATARHSPDESE